MTNEIIAYDPETLLIALKVFRKYFGRKPGKGAWPLDHDMKQYYHLLPMVAKWEELHDAGEFSIDAAHDAAREVGETERSYVHDVAWAYYDVREKHEAERES